MDFKMYICTYILILMHVLMDSIEGRDNGHADEMRPENARLLDIEPEQKHDMMVGMQRLIPEQDDSSTANSDSGDSDNEQKNWLTQVNQYVSKLVMVSNWIPQNNVIYHVTKVVNFWNYNPRFTVVKIGMSNNESNDSNDSDLQGEGASSEDTTTSNGWVGMLNNDVLDDDSIETGIAESLGEEFDGKGTLMRRLILPASDISRQKRSLPILGELIDTAETLLGTVLGIGTGKKGAGGGGSTVDGNVNVRSRPKRSLILI